MNHQRPTLLLLVAPALTLVLGLFVYPLALSLVSAFTARDGGPGLDNFVKAFELYGADIVFTLVIVSVSTVLIGVLAAPFSAAWHSWFSGRSPTSHCGLSRSAGYYPYKLP
jgi:ABC-type sugar transport system permease subunit